MEVTLKTEVESGASGFSVAGGGNEGIFVKQVLKGSPASKIFSLREGDQLLSATIFFDNIKYEDALKILQYSEPYKVQFSLKRKLAGKEELEKIHSTAQHKKEKIKDISMETPEILTVQYSTSAYETKAGNIQDNVKKDLKDMENGLPIYTKKYPEVEINIKKQKNQLSPEIVAKIPSADIAIDRGEMKLEGFEGKTKMPKFQKMKFGISLPKGEIPESEVSLPQMEADIPKPKAIAEVTEIAFETSSLDIKSEDSDAGTDVSGLKMQLPSLKMPQIPKADGAPKVDISLPSVDVTMPTTKVDIRGPDLESKVVKTESEIKSGEKDIEGKESKFKMPKFKLPSFRETEAELTLTVAEVQCPSVDLESDMPIGKDGEKGKTKKPQFSMPKISLPKMKGHKAQVSLPKLESDVSGPKPENEGDVSISTSEFSKPEIKAPKMDMDVSLPTVDVILPTYDGTIQQADLKLRSAGADVKTGIEGPLTVDGAEVKVEESEISLPKMEAGVPQLTMTTDIVSAGKMKMPQVSITDIKAPKMDVSLPSVSVSTTEVEKRGDIDSEGSLEKPQVSAPSAEMQTEIEAPEYATSLPHVDTESAAGKDVLEGKIKSAKAEIPKVGVSLHKVKRGAEGQQLKTHTPKVMIPKAELSTSEISASKTGVDISLPKADITLPKCDLTLQEQKAKLECAEIPTAEHSIELKSPEIGAKAPSVEIALDGTQKKLDALPKVELDILHAGAGVKTEKLGSVIKSTGKDVQGRESKLKMPKFSVPSFGWPATKGTGDVADVKTNLEETKIGAPGIKMDTEISVVDHEIEFPAESVEKDISAGVRVKVEDGDEASKMKTSKFKMPKFGVLHSKAKGSEVDVFLPKLEADVSLPKTELGIVEIQFKKADGSIDLQSPSLDLMESSTRISKDKPDKQSESVEVNIKIPKLKIPAFTYNAPTVETDVSTSKVATDLKGAGTDIETPKLEVSTRIPKERPEFAGGNIQTPSVKIPTLAERDIKTPQVYVKVPDSSVSKAALQIQGLVAESKEIKTQGEAESGHVDIETHETYSSQIVKESEIPSSEIKTASFGFSLLKVKIPESHVKLDMPVKLQSYTEYKHEVSESEVHQPKLSDENLGVAIQKTGTAEFKLSGKPQSETDESNDVVSSSVSLPKLKTFTVEVQPSSKLGDTQSDKQPEEIAVSPLSKDDEIAKIPEDEEKDMKDQKEKTDSKRSSGRFKFWLPSIGFSSSVDDTGSDSKPEVQKSIPEETQPVDSSVSDTDSSQQTEKTGWFRFPKLGFSSPSKKAKNVDKEEETNLKEMKTSDDESPSEKPETFFDAEESLSPKEETITGEENETTGTSSNVQVSGAIVTSSARTELILLERERASQQSILEKTTK
uniref:PDZ domain-containing protein n=1 Tax=Terrapene triunguis TaxID=2587831 RepID=A0A674JFE4_9SAUR